MNTWLRLLGLARPYRGWMVLGILLSALTLFANLALMALSGWFIASMALAGLVGLSINYFTPAAMIRAFAIARTAGRYGERLVTHEATLRLLAGLRLWFYRQLEPQSVNTLAGFRSGDLLSRLRADIDSLDSLYLRVLVPLAVAVLGVGAITALAYAYHPLLALVLAATLLLGGMALPLLTAHLGKGPGREQVQAGADLRIAVIDGVQGMAELQVAGAIDAHAGTIGAAGARLAGAQRRQSRIAGLAQAGLILLSNLALLLVVLVAVPLVQNGALKPAELALLALFSLAAFEAVLPLPEGFRLLGQIKAAAERLFEVADRETGVTEPALPAPRPNRRRWVFEDVALRYPGERDTVLDGVDLVIEAGAKIALLGASGAGKSSLVPLLLRQMEPTSGRLLLGERPLTEYHSEDLRRWIALAPQQFFLFNASLGDNLRLARPEADDEALLQACRIAQLGDFIASLPDGLQTWIGETGVKLSGGQARRLAVARALLRDSDLLILDEPTEGLDQATARHLLRAVLDHLDGRSLLLITHHLAGLDAFDRVLVMDRGRLVERVSPAGPGDDPAGNPPVQVPQKVW